MNYPEYLQDIKAIYRSEVTGEVMFAILSGLSFSAQRKRKWQALRRLESQTKARYLEYVQRQGMQLHFPITAWLGGVVFGLIFCLLPWKTAMKALASGTPPLIAVFERLHKHAGEADKAYFASVVAHEQAIERFAAMELASSDQSLEPVIELLN